MKNKVDIILRLQEIESGIDALNEILQKKQCELTVLQKKCRHEAIVFTEYEKFYGGYDDNLYQKCLFCGTETVIRGYFMHSEVIDVSDFKRENYFSRTQKYDIVKSLYIEMAKANPGATIKEIVSLVKEELEKQNKKFRKVMDKK